MVVVNFWCQGVKIPPGCFRCRGTTIEKVLHPMSIVMVTEWISYRRSCVLDDTEDKFPLPRRSMVIYVQQSFLKLLESLRSKYVPLPSEIFVTEVGWVHQGENYFLF